MQGILHHLTKWFDALLLVMVGFLAPTRPLLIGSIVMVCIDAVLGVMAARKRKELISSAALRRTISKGLVYSLAIIAAFVAQTLLLDNRIKVAHLVAAAIGVVEAKSCLENANAILGVPVFKMLMSKIGSSNDKPHRHKKHRARNHKSDD